MPAVTLVILGSGDLSLKKVIESPPLEDGDRFVYGLNQIARNQGHCLAGAFGALPGGIVTFISTESTGLHTDTIRVTAGPSSSSGWRAVKCTT